MTDQIRGRNVVEHLTPGAHASQVALVEGGVTIRVARADDPAGPTWPERARTVRGLDHPNLAKLAGAKGPDGNTGELAFIASRFVEGATLAEVLTALQPEDANPIASQLAEGLAALHAAGLTHGNIHAGQVRLRADQTPVLLDVAATWGRPDASVSDDVTALINLALTLPLSDDVRRLWESFNGHNMSASDIVAALAAAPVHAAPTLPTVETAPFELAAPALADDQSHIAAADPDLERQAALVTSVVDAPGVNPYLTDGGDVAVPAPFAPLDPQGHDAEPELGTPSWAAAEAEAQSWATAEPIAPSWVTSDPGTPSWAAAEPSWATAEPAVEDTPDPSPERFLAETPAAHEPTQLEQSAFTPAAPELTASPVTASSVGDDMDLLEARETVNVLAQRLAAAQGELARAQQVDSQSISDALAAAKAENHTLDAQVTALAAQLDTFAADLAQSHDELVTASTELESLRAEHTRAIEALNAARVKVVTLERSEAEAASRAEAAGTDALREELARAREQVQTLTTQLQVRARAAGEANAHIAELTARCSYADEQAAAAQHALADMREAAEQIEQLRETARVAEARAAEAREQNAALKRLTSEIALRSRTAEPEADTTARIEALNQELAQLRELAASAQQRAASAEADAQVARQAAAQAAVQVASVPASTGPSAREEALAQEVAELTARLAEVSSERNELQAHVQSLRSAPSSNGEEIERLRAQLELAQNEITRQSAFNSDLQAQLGDMTVAHAHLSAEMSAQRHPITTPPAHVHAPVALPPVGPPVPTIEAFDPTQATLPVMAPIGGPTPVAPGAHAVTPQAPTRDVPAPYQGAPPAGAALPPIAFNDPPTPTFGASGGPSLLGILTDMQRKPGAGPQGA